MTRRIGASVAGLVIVALLAGCLSQEDKNIVDDKKELPVPNTTVACLMMEVEIEDATSGEEKGEHVYCASREEYDANRIGSEWRDKTGQRIE